MSTQPTARTGPTRPVPPRGPELFALGSAVREARARRRLSQEELGFRADLHRNYVGAIERGAINPSFRILLKLMKGLDLPMSEVVSLYERHLPRESPDERRLTGNPTVPAKLCSPR